MFSFNRNNSADIVVQQVDVYFCEKHEQCPDNPDGRRLVQSFPSTGVVNESTGSNALQFNLTSPQFVIGNYVDVWTFVVNGQVLTSEQLFQVYPQLFYTTPIPVVYDFSFHFQPNKFRKGSKQYIIIEVVPIVPRASDLQRYYENLAIASCLKISIEQTCGPCVPHERDLRLVVEEDEVEMREKRFGYYQLDTSEDGLDLECGIYNVWFKLEFGTNIYVSDRQQLQIY